MKAVIDTNIFIHVKNREEPYYIPSKAILDKIDEGALEGVISTIVIAEMSSGYHAAGELREKDEFLTHIVSSQNYRVVEVTVGIADEAGRIRASTGLRLPDALIVASGLKEQAEYLVTYDESLRKADNHIKIATAKEMMSELTG